jgi:hypothetical protein
MPQGLCFRGGDLPGKALSLASPIALIVGRRSPADRLEIAASSNCRRLGCSLAPLAASGGVEFLIVKLPRFIELPSVLSLQLRSN